MKRISVIPIMSNLPSSINAFLAQQDLLTELIPVAVELFRNDIASSGLEDELPRINDIHEFRELVLQIIRKCGGITSEKTMRLLYRVDVPQSKTEATITNGNPENALAEQIVIRELQKAWTRKYFS